ncbi:uncharacterized protein LOC113289980 isoform X1 [Papaver somniferum]|uniref:uncharacterized protein LOC113289980 isoform X1 n=1 Tax=Papaver somniferum TaxID=3469 RepID=UPI000E6F9ADA|nr:uncharacterized protein LOC113289980 isoform X1 [Papaver somniferum]
MYYCRFLLVADITRKKLAHPFQGDYEEKSHEKLHLFIALKFEKPLEFEWGYRGTFADIHIVDELLKGKLGPKIVHIPSRQMKLYMFHTSQVSLHVHFVKSIS